MSILEKLNKAIMEKDGAAAGELVHDDYKMFSHLKGEYVHMGKTGMVEAVSKGMMSPAKYRILFENDEIGFDHSYVTYQDGNTEALMCCWKFKDGKIIEVETGATKLPKYCLLYTSPSPRDSSKSRMPSSA